MEGLRVRRGNTVLTLRGTVLEVEIGTESLGPIVVDADRVEELWTKARAISVPIAVEEGSMGVGGASVELEVITGMVRLTASWWMAPPIGWEPLAEIIEQLSSLVPHEIRTRYDFFQGGE